MSLINSATGRYFVGSVRRNFQVESRGRFFCPTDEITYIAVVAEKARGVPLYGYAEPTLTPPVLPRPEGE